MILFLFSSVERLDFLSVAIPKIFLSCAERVDFLSVAIPGIFSPSATKRAIYILKFIFSFLLLELLWPAGELKKHRTPVQFSHFGYCFV